MSRYRQQGHFNGHWFANRELTLEQAIAQVPAIGAQAPKPGLSAQYGQVHTTQVVSALIGAGYLCVGAGQTRSRNVELRPYAKHVLQFTRPELRGVSLGGDTGDIRIVISNSHDGTGAYIGSLGLFRHACTNSLVVSLGLGCFRVRHHLDAPGEVIEATYRVLDNIPVLQERIAQFQGIQLTNTRALDFAQRASTLRWGKGDAGIEITSLLRPRRVADTRSDLWTVFNRVQENVLKGGVRCLAQVSDRGVTYNRARAVTAPTAVVKLNRQLWELAEEFAGV